MKVVKSPMFLPLCPIQFAMQQLSTGFHPDTRVIGDFPEGNFREVCYIQPGDLVLVRNEARGDQALKEVLACFKQDLARLFKVYYVDAKGPIALPILTTHDQLFWVEGIGWCEAGTLQPDMKIRSRDGFVTVRAAYDATVSSEIHNIEVEDSHTFFVGPNGLSVHGGSPL